MFEQFSARAIDALNHAREEARRLEFVQVDTDHLLLGLLAEGHGVAARTLRKLGVDLRRARQAAEQLGGRGYMRSGDLSFALPCQAAFHDAIAIAAQTNPVLVDTQDLLGALLRQRESRAAHLLRQLGHDPDSVARALSEVRAQDLDAPSVPPAGDQPLPPRHFHPRLLTAAARAAYDLAHQMAQSYGHTMIGTEQLLIALGAAESGLASRVLRANGLDRIAMEAVAHRVMGRGSGAWGARPSLTLRLKDALDAAWRHAQRRECDRVGTGHLLLGLLDMDAGGALTLLDHLRANMATIQYDLEQAMDEHPGDPEPQTPASATT